MTLVVVVVQYTFRTAVMVTVKTLHSPMSTLKIMLQALTVVHLTGMPELMTVLWKTVFS